MSDRSFIQKLENDARQQIRNQNVGYLFGAGASYLDGKGYPLASELWERIRSEIPKIERLEIQAKLDSDGTEGLEHALDLLDPGGPEPTAHRDSVTNAIAELFSTIDPMIEVHNTFIRKVSRRKDYFIPIFTLNYDPLIEYAADHNRIPIIDGFGGVYKTSFYHNIFDIVPSSYSFSPRNKRVLQGHRGILHLYKLHGSIGWFKIEGEPVRISHNVIMPECWQRLMIPPQCRKASETIVQPYSSLWTRFRAWLVHGPNQLNRLVCIGYGMRDQHVNDVIESAIARSDFTLLVFAKYLSPAVLDYWGPKDNVIIVTEDKCFLFGEEGTGHPDLCDFQTLSREV